MRALVLSGGSIKGAFQAGAIRWILEHGFVPELVYGISVGALNGAFLAERSGRRLREGRPVDWAEIGRELEQFWIRNVTGPRVIIRKRRAVPLVLRLAFNRFDGLTDTEPLREMIHREVKAENMHASGIRFEAGAVNMHDGEIVYARHDWPDILDYVYASTAIPIAMPLVDVRRGGSAAPFYDGGVRDIAPVGRAFNVARAAGDPLTEVVVIVCQPERITGGHFRRGHILELSGRLMEIVSTEIVENDLGFVKKLNELLDEEDSTETQIGGKTYRKLEPVLIRPDEEIDVHIDRFTSDDIRYMLERGRAKAQRLYPPASQPA